MALQFPPDPSAVGNVYEAPNGVIYYYDGVKWVGHGVPANVSLAEAAQDATASMLAAGNQSGILATYHDDLNSMDLTVQLPVASDTVLGGIKVGHNLEIIDGVLNSITEPYTLPTASDVVLGGVKVGSHLSISDGVLSTNPYTLGNVAPVGNLSPPAVLDLTKQVFVLGTGSWNLQNGVSGQICYFVMDSTGVVNNASVIIDNVRVVSSNAAVTLQNATWYPFDTTAGSDSDANTTVTAIFIDGAWNVSAGLINP